MSPVIGVAKSNTVVRPLPEYQPAKVEPDLVGSAGTTTVVLLATLWRIITVLSDKKVTVWLGEGTNAISATDFLGVSGSLLPSNSVLLTYPLYDADNVIVTVTVFPELIVIGKVNPGFIDSRDEFEPENTAVEITRSEAPLFAIVNVLLTLVPMITVPKSRELGDVATFGTGVLLVAIFILTARWLSSPAAS